MSDTVSITELDGQHVELLAARTVLSMFSAQVGDGVIPGGGLGEVVTGITDAAGVGSSSTSGPAGSAEGAGTG